jgi:hypothetical protein
MSRLKPSVARRRRSEASFDQLERRRAQRRRQSTVGWEKEGYGPDFATRPDNSFTEDWERRYHGEQVNDDIKEKWEGIHENSFGNDKRDPMTYHARKKLSKETRVALERKAAKALILAKSILGNVEEEILEDQAAELMDLPTKALNSTLQRVFAMEGEIDEVVLEEKVKELLDTAEEVAEAAGVESDEEGEEEAGEEELGEDLGEDLGEEAPVEEEEAAGEEMLSEDEIQGILYDEGGMEASVEASSEEENFFAVDDLVGQLFDEVGVEASAEAPVEDEVSQIEQRLASTEKKGVKKLVATSTSEPAGDEASSLWEQAPDVSNVFGNRRR